MGHDYKGFQVVHLFCSLALRTHSLASWFMATITGCGIGLTLLSSSILGLLASGSPAAAAASSPWRLWGRLTTTGGEVEAWAARIWRGLVSAGERGRGVSSWACLALLLGHLLEKQANGQSLSTS